MLLGALSLVGALSFTGHVYDAYNSAPIPFASVSFKQGAIYSNVTTDSSGSYAVVLLGGVSTGVTAKGFLWENLSQTLVTGLSNGILPDIRLENRLFAIRQTQVSTAKGALTVSGTEYSPSDSATIFLSLRDSQSLPVLNGSCYLTIYNPLFNGTHAYLVFQAPMINLNDSNGIYYYDLIVPSTLGVYMLAASCSYSYDLVDIYPFDYPSAPSVQRTLGTWSGDSLSLNSKEDGLYERCDAGGGNGCLSNYTWDTTNFSTANLSNLSLYWGGKSDKTPNMTFSFWNGTAFRQLINTKVLAATFSGASSSSVDEYVTNSVPIAALINNTLKIQLSAAAGGTFTLFNNWLVFRMLSSTGTVQDLKGNSEMHVTDLSNATAFSNLQLLLNSTNNSIHVAIARNSSDLQLLINSTNKTLHNALALNFSDVQLLINSTNKTLHIAMAANFSDLQLLVNSTNSTLHLALNSNSSGIIGAIFFANGSIQAAMGQNSTNLGLLINSTNDSLHLAILNNQSGLMQALVSANGTILAAMGANQTSLFDLIAFANGTILASIAANTSNLNSSIGWDVWGYTGDKSVNATLTNVSINVSALTAQQNQTLYDINERTTITQDLVTALSLSVDDVLSAVLHIISEIQDGIRVYIKI